jgi:hypothetical protein
VRLRNDLRAHAAEPSSLAAPRRMELMVACRLPDDLVAALDRVRLSLPGKPSRPAIMRDALEDYLSQGVPQNVLNQAAGGGGGAPQSVLNTASAEAPRDAQMQVTENVGPRIPPIASKLLRAGPLAPPLLPLGHYVTRTGRAAPRANSVPHLDRERSGVEGKAHH